MLRWTSWTMVFRASFSFLASFSLQNLPCSYGFLPILSPLVTPRICPQSLRTKQATTMLCEVTSGGSSNYSSCSSTEGGATVPSVLLPPKDDTYESPVAFLRELRSSLSPSEGLSRYDRIGKATGGIWRSKVLGILPATVMTSSLATSWLFKAESAGDVVNTWPEGVAILFGRKSIISLGDRASVHMKVRRIYQQALSPKAVVVIAPFVESCLARRAQKWAEMAKTGEEVRMFDEISSFTMEVIIHAFLGDYGTEKVLQDSVSLLPKIANGLFSITRHFWWPLNLFYPFNFGPALRARKKFDTMMAKVVNERRSALGAVENDARTGGVLDTMLEMQTAQRAAGGPKDGEIEYDDNFIYDNMMNAMIAGFDTTSVTLTRTLQYIESSESKELDLKERLLEELRGDVVAEEDHVEGDPTIISSKSPGNTAGGGVFRAFPLLDAVVLEASRMSPAAGGVFRKAKKDLEYNGFLIPEGEPILWSLANEYVSESFYPQHTKFCPFRFLQGRKDNPSTSSSNDAMSPAEALEDQPRPMMFGIGKHMCPGQELAKLEILLFLKFFLPKYGYRLVKGQKLHGSVTRPAPKDGLRVVLTLICG